MGEVRVRICQSSKKLVVGGGGRGTSKRRQGRGHKNCRDWLQARLGKTGRAVPLDVGRHSSPSLRETSIPKLRIRAVDTSARYAGERIVGLLVFGGIRRDGGVAKRRRREFSRMSRRSQRRTTDHF